MKIIESNKKETSSGIFMKYKLDKINDTENVIQILKMLNDSNHIVDEYEISLIKSENDFVPQESVKSSSIEDFAKDLISVPFSEIERIDMKGTYSNCDINACIKVPDCNLNIGYSQKKNDIEIENRAK